MCNRMDKLEPKMIKTKRSNCETRPMKEQRWVESSPGVTWESSRSWSMGALGSYSCDSKAGHRWGRSRARSATSWPRGAAGRPTVRLGGQFPLQRHPLPLDLL